jgi:hypothetical protein
MEPLSEEFVERTWQEIAVFAPERATKEMHAMGKSQPELLAFLLAYAEDLKQEAKELAIYIAFVVYKMFLDSAGKIPKISSKEIMTLYNENALLLEGLKGAPEKIIDKIEGLKVPNQPYVMKYVLEALLEDAEEEGIDLAEEDIGSLFILFKTEIEVLDKRA